MTDSERRFRDELRAARSQALRDAEGFVSVCQCLERVAFFHMGHGHGLGGAWPAVRSLASRSPLAFEIPERYPEAHSPAERLFDLVRVARNEAVHEGAYARTVTRHALELALVIEDALQESAMLVQDFMVRDPVVAELWEPLSFIRQKMLANSFSFLPVRTEPRERRLISDRALARYLRGGEAAKPKVRRARLAERLGEATALELDPAETCYPDDPVGAIADRITDRPILVVSRADGDRLLGIVTAFDLL